MKRDIRIVRVSANTAEVIAIVVTGVETPELAKLIVNELNKKNDSMEFYYAIKHKLGDAT